MPREPTIGSDDHLEEHLGPGGTERAGCLDQRLDVDGVKPHGDRAEGERHHENHVGKAQPDWVGAQHVRRTASEIGPKPTTSTMAGMVSGSVATWFVARSKNLERICTI